MENERPSEWYPPKPMLEKVKIQSNWGMTVFSILVFALSFLYLFSDEVDFVFFLVLVLFIHELGHYLIMKFYKYENLRMLFIPLMGAFVQGSKKQYSQKESFFVIAAGPYPGIILGISLLFLAQNMQHSGLLKLSFLFLFLNVVNLLPLDPLDGGQFFKLFVRRKRDLFLLIFSLLSSLVMIIVGYMIESWILIIFGFLMSFKVRSFQRNFLYRKILDERQINYECNYEDLSDINYHQIKQVILQENPKLVDFIGHQQENAEELVASQVNSVLSVPYHRDTTLLFKVLLIASWLLFMLLPVFLLLGPLLDFTWYFEEF